MAGDVITCLQCSSCCMLDWVLLLGYFQQRCRGSMMVTSRHFI
jgi:hypothetical protein